MVLLRIGLSVTHVPGRAVVQGAFHSARVTGGGRQQLLQQLLVRVDRKVCVALFSSSSFLANCVKC